MMLPFQVLGVWLRGLFALVLLAAGVFLLAQWYTHRHSYVVEVQSPTPGERAQTSPPSGPPVRREVLRRVDWQFGLNRETAFLVGGVGLLGWSVAGGWLFRPGLFRRRSADAPHSARTGEVRTLRRPDGTALHVELYGPPDGPPIVVTHGWGADSEEWYYAKKELGDRFRLITWDLPGLGKSEVPREVSLEAMARDLDAVAELVAPRPVTVVGHSIGGMIILTYCKLFPHALGTRVRGLVLAHSTYTNPLRTMSGASFYTAIQKPILEPLCHLMIWLSPLVRALNWLSYRNGSAHRSTERSSFSGNESREQLDFVARYSVKMSPAVIGRGMLAMFGYDATPVLATIPVPVLVVVGDADGQTTPEAGALMSEAIPHATLFTLREAKHWGLFEHHREFFARVVEFVAACAVDESTAAEVTRRTHLRRAG